MNISKIKGTLKEKKEKVASKIQGGSSVSLLADLTELFASLHCGPSQARRPKKNLWSQRCRAEPFYR